MPIKEFVKNNYGTIYISCCKAGLLALAILFIKYFLNNTDANINQFIILTIIAVLIFDILLFYTYSRKNTVHQNLFLLATLSIYNTGMFFINTSDLRILLFLTFLWLLGVVKYGR